MKLLIFLFVLPCSLATQPQLSSAAATSGVLTGEDGSLIAGARVGLLLQSPPSHGKALQTFWSVASGADGSFRFSGLKAATYKMCVEPGGVWLNPCEWGLNPPILTLSNQQTASSANVVLTKGALITIKINDPGQCLAKNEGAAPGAHLLIGVPTAAFSFHAASIESQNTAGRTYQAVIPFNYPAVVIIRSPYFHLSNASGVALPAGATVPITAASGQAPSPLTFTVTGTGR